GWAFRLFLFNFWYAWVVFFLFYGGKRTRLFWGGGGPPGRAPPPFHPLYKYSPIFLASPVALL
ncbi:hypothetical protein, partial [Pseudomonas aeruginosa]|uniref:hypothetical protein n=1 Tax=Pseudomonas aeruginosa TaxID=287 RepID=UPI0039BE2F56